MSVKLLDIRGFPFWLGKRIVANFQVCGLKGTAKFCMYVHNLCAFSVNKNVKLISSA